MTDSPVHYLMRDADQGDVGFIVGGWLSEMRHSPWTRFVPNHIYIPAQRELIHRLLGPSQVTLACNRDNPDHLFGVVVHERPIVHWLYVKGAYRGLGIARALLFSAFGGKPDRILATQLTQLFQRDSQIADRYNVLFSPYALLGIPFPSAEESAPAELSAG